jgi:hypothetical protein
MPWTSADAKTHSKRANTPAKQKKWASIANAALESCKKKGGSDCEGSAIRIANSRMSDNTSPISALSFSDPEAFAQIIDGEKFEMVVYSGKPISNHFFWGNLSIDLEGIQFTRGRYPILMEHDPNLKIGFTKKPKIDNNQLIVGEGFSFVDTPESQKFQSTAKEGFPYQASLSGRPTIVERLEEGESTTVNGHKISGPGAIWRKTIFREASVCVFGADTNTSSRVFNDNEEEVTFELTEKLSDTQILEEVEKPMTFEELKAAHPDLFKVYEEQILGAAKVEAKAEAQKEIEAKEKAKTEKDSVVQDELKQLQESVKELKAENTSLREKNKVREEKDIEFSAKTIWEEQLKAGSIPERIHSKVKGLVSFKDFVKEDVFDETAFTDAVKKEVDFWASSGYQVSVEGFGSTQRGDENKGVDEEAKKMALFLGNLSGRQLKKEAA